MRILVNAFSLNMVKEFPADIKVVEIPLDQARALVQDGFISAVGHADTAAVFANTLGVAVPANRATVSFCKNEQVLVGQYSGTRLPEGARTLPDGANIRWFAVTVL